MARIRDHVVFTYQNTRDPVYRPATYSDIPYPPPARKASLEQSMGRCPKAEDSSRITAELTRGLSSRAMKILGRKP